MNNITLFVKDFQKGTELSDHLATAEINVTFAESIYDIPDQCKLGIIDLDDKKFGNVKFVSELKSKTQLTLLGYMVRMHKDTHDKLKAAGCKMVFTKASIVKNVQSLVQELVK